MAESGDPGEESPQPGVAPDAEKGAPDGRSPRFWLVGGGLVLVVVAIALTLLGSDKPKPDIITLTDTMFLTATEFPVVDGGRYRLSSVITMRDEQDPKCGWGGMVQRGEAGVATDSRDKTMEVLLVVAERKPDLGAFPDCLPDSVHTFDVPGLPSGAVAFSLAGDGEGANLSAFGYVRGVLMRVAVKDRGGAMDQVKADLVTVYNRQADKLDKA
ncbi:hypothetical protein MINS_06680 [Mycolicibacterium insubricum]|uniref:Uncharacterized protein n=1 Tax=Mycolicibacterium insubricum TaxID=444597 RepID=A0A1X0D8P5_9MYCO|nr:hypothetical protein [Mycolicibacterium insubricum]MCV7082809.1 hypothetical protein [Mycolicibacterium insubricum]ORA68589.1 hypothetical protein BST26_14195 [Mycolicibacterium insubricum]BBZ65239.1 hypothetical protein MINS_06680 [Mycolicibacterium insubricum]